MARGAEVWRTGAWLATLLAVAVAVAGCERDEGVEVGETPGTAAPVGTAAGADTTSAAAREPGATDGRTVDSRLTEWDMGLSDDNVRSGEVTFRVANAGTVQHALEVEGEGIEEETGHLEPGRNATLTVNLPPGTYEVYCPVTDDQGSHRERGMVSTLIVQ